MARSPHNRLDLEERVERQPRDLDRRARGLVVAEELGVDRVHGLEVVHRLEEHLRARVVNTSESLPAPAARGITVRS